MPNTVSLPDSIRACLFDMDGVLYRGDQRAAIHGQNESIDVEAYKRGVGFYTEFIRHLDMLDGVR